MVGQRVKTNVRVRGRADVTLGNHSSDDDVAETMALTRLWMEVTRTEEQR